MKPLPLTLKNAIEAEKASKATKELIAAAIRPPCFTPPDRTPLVLPSDFTKRDLKRVQRLRKLCRGTKTDAEIIAKVIIIKEEDAYSRID